MSRVAAVAVVAKLEGSDNDRRTQHARRVRAVQWRPIERSSRQVVDHPCGAWNGADLSWFGEQHIVKINLELQADCISLGLHGMDLLQLNRIAHGIDGETPAGGIGKIGIDIGLRDVAVIAAYIGTSSLKEMVPAKACQRLQVYLGIGVGVVVPSDQRGNGITGRGVVRPHVATIALRDQTQAKPVAIDPERLLDLRAVLGTEALMVIDQTFHVSAQPPLIDAFSEATDEPTGRESSNQVSQQPAGRSDNLHEAVPDARPIPGKDAGNHVPTALDDRNNQIEGVTKDFAYGFHHPVDHRHNNPDKAAQPFVAAKTPPVAILLHALFNLLGDVVLNPFSDLITIFLRHLDSPS